MGLKITVFSGGKCWFRHLGKWISTCALTVIYGMSACAQHLQDTSFINQLTEKSSLLTRQNPDSARLLAEEVIKRSTALNYSKGLGDAYTRLGILQKDLGVYDSAIVLYQKSLGFRRSINDQLGMGRCYSNIGNAFNYLSEYDSALYYHFAGLRIFESAGAEKDRINSLNNVGNIYKNTEDYTEAEDYYQQSLDAARSLKDSSAMGRAFSNLGSVYIETDDFPRAEVVIREALPLLENNGMKLELAKSLGNMGLIKQKYKQLDSALVYFSRAESWYVSLNQNRNLALVLGNMGVIYMDQKKAAEAIQVLERSVRLSEIGDKKLTYTNYENLAQAYRLNGEADKAFEALKQSQEYKDAVFNEDKATAFSEIQTKYETEKKVQQITLLNEQNKVQRLQKNIFLSGAIFLLVTAVGLFLFFRQKQQLAHRNDLIQKQQISELLNTQEIRSLNAMMEGQEKERKRIAADLHDRIGGSLAAIKLHLRGFADRVLIPEPEQNQLNRVNTMFDDVVKEVRQVSHDLASGVLMKFGLVSALKDLSESIESSGHLKMHFDSYGLDQRLDHRTEISLYRICQELISNVLKHAQASEINLHLTRQNGLLSFMAEDNGNGFDVSKASGGLGMKNIRSRVSQLHGSVFFDSKPGRGCTVTVEIPLTAKT